MKFDNNKKNIVLFEYGKPLMVDRLMNYQSGIWMWCLTPGEITFDDDQGVTGYYGYTNALEYQVESMKVDNEPFLKVNTLSDLFTQDEAFYYDDATSFVYIAFTNHEPKLNKKIYIGVTIGMSKGDTGYRYNNIYYDPRVTSILGISKSKDPLFYGQLKFSSGSVKVINTDGEFDDFGDRDLYRVATKVLIGQEGDEYDDFVETFNGLLGNYSYSWKDLDLKVEDLRSGLTDPIPPNKYITAVYPTIKDSNVDKPKPIAYGPIINAKCVCLNTEADGSGDHTFMFMDTEFHSAAALTKVYFDGDEITETNVSLSGGTFTLTAVQIGTKFTKITADFTGSSIVNGVDIIKDLMANYANTSYIDANYDLIEMALAQTASRDTSFYTNKNTTLIKAIGKICVDIDGIFFPKDDGLYSIRIFDIDRASTATILKDDWKTPPTIKNNTDEFLSSVVIKYNKDQAENEYSEYDNTDYEEDTYDTYKSKQSTEIITGLTTLSDATAKSESVMSTSKIVTDTVTRAVSFEFYELEIMDFITCDPKARRSEVGTPAIWEILGINKDLDLWTINLTLRYIKAV